MFVGAVRRQTVLQLCEPQYKVLEVIFDVFTPLGIHVSEIARDWRETHLIVFYQGIDASQTRFERRENIGRLTCDIQ